MDGYKTIYVDVMVDDRFYCQVPYEYCPLWPIDVQAVGDYVRERKPGLRKKKFKMAFSNQRIGKR